MKIEIYTKNYCPYCIKAKKLLKLKGVTANNINEINIENNIDNMKEMLTRTNGKKTLPQIFINNTYVGGYDDLYNLEKLGKLNNLLNLT